MPNSYRDDTYYRMPSSDELAGMVDAFINERDDMQVQGLASAPLTQTGQDIVAGLLRFVDHHLPQDNQPRARYPQVRACRTLARTALIINPESRLDLDDLTQDLRLRTVIALGRHMPEKGTIFSLLSKSLSRQIQASSYYAFRSGFTYGSTGRANKITTESPLYVLERQVTKNSPEDGFSDTLEQLTTHPRYAQQVQLTYEEPFETTFEDDPTETHQHYPLEPTVDDVDAETRDWQSLIELPPTETLDRLFDMAERWEVPFSNREKIIFRYIYEQGFSMEKTGAQAELNITKARIHQIHDRALRRVRNSLLDKLQDLRRD